MKLNRIFFTLALVFSLSFLMVSCGSSDSSGEKMEEVDKSGPEYTSAYVCPMHCEGSGSDSEGKCPVCGMAYVENKDHAGDSHEGHNH
jgi:hypothetical protein